MSEPQATDASPASVATPYCAYCRDALRLHAVDYRLAGQRFLCPKETAAIGHVAAVCTDDVGRCWLRFEQWLVTRRRCIDRLPIPPLLLHFLLLLVALLLLAPRGGYAKVLALVIAAYFLYDTFLYSSRVAFVTQRPRVPLRAVLLAVGAVVELSLAFAVAYASLPDSEFTRALTPASAVYFSLVTLATVGYGDIAPCADAQFAHWLVAGEIAAGIYFIAALLATIVSFASNGPRLPTYKELAADSARIVEGSTVPNGPAKNHDA